MTDFAICMHIYISHTIIVEIATNILYLCTKLTHVMQEYDCLFRQRLNKQHARLLKHSLLNREPTCSKSHIA